MSLIPLPIQLGIGAAIVAAAGLGVHHYGATRFAAGQGEVQARWDAQTLQRQQAAIQAQQEAALETQRRLTAQKENDDAQAQRLAAATADAASAADAAARLRNQVAALIAAARHRAAASNSTPVASGPAASTPADLPAGGDALDTLSILFARTDETAGILAQALDRSYLAGKRCEADYDALTNH